MLTFTIHITSPSKIAISKNSTLIEVRERQISYDIIYMWNLKKKKIQMNLLNQNRLTDIENTLIVAERE